MSEVWSEIVNRLLLTDLELVAKPPSHQRKSLNPKGVARVLQPLLDSFGSSRGLLAHSSIKVQQSIDVYGQYKKVNAIVKGLRILDRQIGCLR